MSDRVDKLIEAARVASRDGDIVSAIEYIADAIYYINVR